MELIWYVEGYGFDFYQKGVFFFFEFCDEYGDFYNKMNFIMNLLFLDFRYWNFFFVYESI